MADADTTVAARQPGVLAVRRDPDELASQIEQTRAELARTIDSIADRVNPARAARRAAARARERAARLNPKVAAAGAAVLVVAVAIVVLRRRRP